jgi:hypothetical protein
MRKEDFVTHTLMMGCSEENFGLLESLLLKHKSKNERAGLIIDLISPTTNSEKIKELLDKYNNLLVVDALQRNPIQKSLISRKYFPYYVGSSDGGGYLKNEK